MGGTGGDVNGATSSSAADSGNTMGWAGSQYQFNLSTRRSQFNSGSDLTLDATS